METLILICFLLNWYNDIIADMSESVEKDYFSGYIESRLRQCLEHPQYAKICKYFFTDSTSSTDKTLWEKIFKGGATNGTLCNSDGEDCFNYPESIQDIFPNQILESNTNIVFEKEALLDKQSCKKKKGNFSKLKKQAMMTPKIINKNGKTCRLKEVESKASSHCSSSIKQQKKLDTLLVSS